MITLYLLILYSKVVHPGIAIPISRAQAMADPPRHHLNHPDLDLLENLRQELKDHPLETKVGNEHSYLFLFWEIKQLF